MALQERETAKVVRGWPTRVFHANFNASDWKRTLDFYTEICGFEEVYRTNPEDARRTAAFISNGNMHHDKAIYSRPDKPPGYLGHFGYDVDTEAELVEIYKRLTEADVKWRSVDKRYWRQPDGSMSAPVTIHLYFDDP